MHHSILVFLLWQYSADILCKTSIISSKVSKYDLYLNHMCDVIWRVCFIHLIFNPSKLHPLLVFPNAFSSMSVFHLLACNWLSVSEEMWKREKKKQGKRECLICINFITVLLELYLNKSRPACTRESLRGGQQPWAPPF